MKIIKILLLLSLSLMLFSCGDDDDSKLAPDSLKQTSWKGIYIEGDNETGRKGSVGLVFNTDKGGYYDLQYTEKDNSHGYFRYSLDGKLLVMWGGSVEGNWLIVSKSKNEMTLERGSGATPATKIRMVLERDI